MRDDGTGGPITAPAFIKCLCVNGRLQTESEEGESLKKHPTLPMQSSSNRLANIIYHGEKWILAELCRFSLQSCHRTESVRARVYFGAQTTSMFVNDLITPPCGQQMPLWAITILHILLPRYIFLLLGVLSYLFVQLMSLNLRSHSQVTGERSFSSA